MYSILGLRILICLIIPNSLAFENKRLETFNLPKDTTVHLVVKEEQATFGGGFGSGGFNLTIDYEEESTLDVITKERAEQDLSYETVDEYGNKKDIRVKLKHAFVDYLNEYSEKLKKAELDWDLLEEHRRNRRDVFQDDTRFPITEAEAFEGLPFSAVVTFNIGCSGILVGEKHVLTAAHCFHDGKKYIHKTKDIRVGFRKNKTLSTYDVNTDPSKAFYWIRVAKLNLPAAWSITRYSRKGALLPVPLHDDYAIVELKRSPDNREPMDFSISSHGNVGAGTRVHMGAFDEQSDQSVMMYRYCPVAYEEQSMTYQFCDASSSASGAGVYIREWNGLFGEFDRKVVGVFVGKHTLREGSGREEKVNAALRLTPLKFAQVCFWITGSYSSCHV
ncbi:serine protease 23-like [Antedon mediterranea]|uniref:serine protease 23-like n=1 Tax=Antedon mediterranea TaxID=105859 RepID=UPI003AF747C4